jgi:hypothetical protein
MTDVIIATKRVRIMEKDLPDMPELYRFEELSSPERLVIRLRCDGRSYSFISEALKREFELERSEETIRGWLSFSATKDGHLAEPFAEYKRMLAEEASDEARAILRVARKSAAVALTKSLTSNNDGVVVRAAALILGSELTAPRGSGGFDDDFLDPTLTPEMEAAIVRQTEIIAAGRKALEVSEAINE